MRRAFASLSRCSGEDRACAACGHGLATVSNIKFPTARHYEQPTQEYQRGETGQDDPPDFPIFGHFAAVILAPCAAIVVPVCAVFVVVCHSCARSASNNVKMNLAFRLSCGRKFCATLPKISDKKKTPTCWVGRGQGCFVSQNESHPLSSARHMESLIGAIATRTAPPSA